MFTKINTKITEARDDEGFTLIELLVVILIIGILAAIAIPVFLNQQKAAVKGGIKSDVRNTATNIATSLVTSPSATGFTPYAAGATAPAVTGGAVAVQTVNSADDVITITNNPADGSSPSTGTGAGQWDDYQIIGTSARVPNYCFVFSSKSGKYTEYNDCTVAPGSGTATSTPTDTPAAGVVIYSATFDAGTESWSPFSTGTAVTSSTAQHHSGTASLSLTPTGVTSPYMGTTFRTTQKTVTGKTYNVTMWVYNVGPNPVTLQQSPDGTDVVVPAATTVGTGTWVKIDTNFTASTSTAGHQFTIKTDKTTNSGFFIDDVVLTQTS